MTYFLKNLDLSKLNKKQKRRAGHKPLNPFPVKLYKMLTSLAEKGEEDIVSWSPDGASFLVHDNQRLVSEALPAYFNQTKYKSFQRQLNFYGFSRVLDGPLEGSYWHPMFRRGQEQMCRSISRKVEQASSQPQMREHSLPDIIIPEPIPAEEAEDQEVEFVKPHNSQSPFETPIIEDGLFEIEPSPLLFQESIISLTRPIFSHSPPRLTPQESILANGHTAHNFGKSFFFVEDGTDEPLPPRSAAV